jgi:lambda family phage portal protein
MTSMLIDVLTMPEGTLRPHNARTSKPAPGSAPGSSAAPSRQIRGSYDAAQTTAENAEHWRWADSLSAQAALRPEVRKIIRERCRYEVGSNTYAKGIAQTLTNYIVGTGPTLQVLTENRQYNRAVEAQFRRWSRAIKWTTKLWTMGFAWVVDGESFARETNNPNIRDAVKLNLTPIECDQIDTPIQRLDVQPTDGIVYDDWGDPMAYHVLKVHPGALYAGALPNDYDTVPAEQMRHLFRVERPGQRRGVSLFTPGLPLFAQLRRYTLAVLAAAETAADIAGLLTTTWIPDQPAAHDPLESFPVRRREMLTLPEGYDFRQVKAEQPTTTYDMFKKNIISEMARGFEMPKGIAGADFSGYNFASGKLDIIGFMRHVNICQDLFEESICDIDFARWYAEARLIPGYLPPSPGRDVVPPVAWTWDGMGLLDPREAGRQETQLKSLTTTLAKEYGREGEDWEEQLQQRAKELGMTFEELQKAMRDQLFALPDPESAAAPGRGAPEDKEEDDSEDQ